MHKEYSQFAHDHSDGLVALHKLKAMEYAEYNASRFGSREKFDAEKYTVDALDSRTPRDMTYVALMRTEVAKLLREASTLTVPNLDDPAFWVALIDQPDRTHHHRFEYSYYNKSKVFLEYKGGLSFSESDYFMISTGWTLAILDGHDDAISIAFQPRVIPRINRPSYTLAFPSQNWDSAFLAIKESDLRTYARRLQKIEPMVLNCMSGKAPYDAYGVKPGGHHGHILKNTPRDNTQTIMECMRRLDVGRELAIDELLDELESGVFDEDVSEK